MWKKKWRVLNDDGDWSKWEVVWGKVVEDNIIHELGHV